MLSIFPRLEQLHTALLGHLKEIDERRKSSLSSISSTSTSSTLKLYPLPWEELLENATALLTEVKLLNDPEADQENAMDEGLEGEALEEATKARRTAKEKYSRVAWEGIVELGRGVCLDVAQNESSLPSFSHLSTSTLSSSPEHVLFYTSILDRLDVILAFLRVLNADHHGPFQILDDLFANLTAAGSYEIFSFLETRRNILGLPHAEPKGAALPLLKACNGLLRSLSKSQPLETLFSGRILLFMTSSFSLTARSGVNLRGDWNQIETAFEDDESEVEEEEAGADATDASSSTKKEEEEDTEMKAMEEEEGEIEEEFEEGESGKTPPPDSVKKEDAAKSNVSKERPAESFYKTFWSLQAYFSNPTLITNPDSFKTFINKSEIVFKTLKEQTEKEKMLRGSSDKKTTTLVQKTPAAAKEIKSFPKYLTSKKLLDFELSDVSFRRHISIQLLILLHFLKSFAPGITPGDISGKKMPNLKLDSEQGVWINSMWDRVLQDLRQTHPDGEGIASMLLLILQRENNWDKWKNTKCRQFEEDPVSDDVMRASAAKRRRLDSQGLSKRMDFPLGTRALSELWRHDFVSVTNLERPTPLPSFQSFLGRLQDEDFDINLQKGKLERLSESDPSRREVEEEIVECRERKDSLTWRSMRLVARSDFSLFNNFRHSVTGKDGKVMSAAQPVDEWVQIVVTADEKRTQAANDKAVAEVATGVKATEESGVTKPEAEADALEFTNAEAADADAPATAPATTTSSSVMKKEEEDDIKTEEKADDKTEDEGGAVTTIMDVASVVLEKNAHGTNLGGIASFSIHTEPESLVAYGLDGVGKDGVDEPINPEDEAVGDAEMRDAEVGEEDKEKEDAIDEVAA